MLKKEWARIKENKIAATGTLVFMACLLTTSNLGVGLTIMVIYLIFLACLWMEKKYGRHSKRA